MTNVRGFHGNQDIDLDLTRPDGSHAGWTVVAGRNGSGKTSMLRAMMLAVAGPTVARNLVSGFENWISVDRTEGLAEVQLAWDPEFDKWSSAGRTPDGPFWAGLRWKAPESGLLFDQVPDMQPSLDEYIRRGLKSAGRGPWQDNPRGWFSAAYGPFRRLTGGAGENQRLAYGPAPVARLVSLFHEDASLAEGVSWLIDQHLRALEGRPGAARLRDAALAVLGDGLLPDDYQIRRVNSDGLWVEYAGREFPLREMSDGYRTVAALVVDVLKQLNAAYGDLRLDETSTGVRLSLPGIVIIDEVDAHLHVSWQKRIGKWLKQHFPLVQFIVTTHSPYICQDADVGGLVKLPGRDEPSEVPRVVDRDLYERVVFGSGDDAVLSELFGIDTPFSTEAEQLRSELVALEVDVVRGIADDAQTQRYLELKELLTSSNTSRVVELAARLTDISGTPGE